MHSPKPVPVVILRDDVLRHIKRTPRLSRDYVTGDWYVLVRESQLADFEQRPPRPSRPDAAALHEQAGTGSDGARTTSSGQREYCSSSRLQAPQQIPFLGRHVVSGAVSDIRVLENAGMPAARGVSPAPDRNSDDPTVQIRVSIPTSSATAAREYAHRRRMSVSSAVEYLIAQDNVDRFARPRWATARSGTPAIRTSSSSDPIRRVHLCLTRSVYWRGRAYAAAGGMTFSGYVEQLILRNRAGYARSTRLEQTA
jgi:hypothetical protein